MLWPTLFTSSRPQSLMAPTLNINQTLKKEGITQTALRMPNGETLTLHRIVRYVPHRRLVCQGTWQQQSVFAKLFVGESQARYATRDALGVQRLVQAGVQTPPLLYQAQLDTPASTVLIYQAIAGGENAEEAYANASPSQRKSLVTGLMQTLAAHHQAGLLQTDLYLKNFLIRDDTIYTIDGDAIRQPKRLPNTLALRNVAMLLSNIDVIELEQYLPMWMQAYGEARQWQTQPDVRQVKVMVDRARQRIVTAYADKKVFRTCTDVQVQHTKAQFVAYANAFFAEIEPLSASTLDGLLDAGQALKTGNTSTVGVNNLQGKPVVIKRYNIKNIWHGLSRAFRPSRATRSWANAHRLQLLKMATPQPVALLETYRLPCIGVRWRSQAYFVSVFVDVPDASTFFAQTTDKAVRAEAVKQLTLLLYRFYLLKLSHGDMKATNIKMQDTTPMLIDLDSMQQHRWAYFAQQAHVRDLQRFMQNWKHDTSLYNAFIKSFKVVYADHTALQQANILSD